MYVISQQEVISMALKTAYENEKSIALKYQELSTTITDPTIQQHLKSLEQTARNHINLIIQQLTRLNIQ